MSRFTEVENDALEAYRTAIESVEGSVEQSKLREFRDAHVKHIQNLVPLLQALGEQPPRAGDWRQIVIQGRVMLGGPFGDKAVLRAMAVNELNVNEGYARAIERPDFPDALRPLFEDHLNHSQHHSTWLFERMHES